MNSSSEHKAQNTILIVDDTPTIHDDFRKVFQGADTGAESIDDAAATFFGETRVPVTGLDFRFESAFQGDEAICMVRQSLSQGRPYGIAFVDMRMPPGIDGLTTIKGLWEADPALEIIMCTAYSDRSWSEIQRAVGLTDQLLILKKPFDQIEVRQLVLALSEKWTTRRLLQQRMQGLEEAVQARTSQWLRANQSKNEFLANISHELLTPMNGILGMAELLESAALNEEERGWLQDIRSSGNVLHQLLKKVLQFNEIHAGRFALTPQVIDVNELCASVKDSHAALARSKGLRLEVELPSDLPSEFRADTRALKQLLSLLVENAIKFTERGTIKLKGQASHRGSQGCVLEFSVEDTGPGLSKEEVSALEHPLVQLNGGATRKNGGIGLGLTFARALLELMGGTLSIESTLRKGSKFSMQIPGAPTPPIAA